MVTMSYDDTMSHDDVLYERCDSDSDSESESESESDKYS